MTTATNENLPNQANAEQDLFEEVLEVLDTIDGGASQFILDSNHENVQPLIDVVGTVKEDLIGRVLKQHCGSKKLKEFIKAIFDGASLSKSSGLSKRCVIFETVVRLLSTKQLTGKPAKTVLDFLLTEVDNIPDSVMPWMVEVIVDQPISPDNETDQQYDYLEFIPKCLHIIKQAPVGSLDPDRRCKQDYSDVDGGGFLRVTVEKLCAKKWSNRFTRAILSVLREVIADMEEPILHLVTSNALQVIYTSNIVDVPELVGELLLFLSQQSAKEQSEVLHKVIQHFDSADTLLPNSESQDSSTAAASPKHIAPELKSKVQGAILNRFNLAVSQNLKLGNTFLKQSSGFAGHLSCFRIAMLLSLMRIKRLEEKVKNLIVKRIQESLECTARQNSSVWMRDTMINIDVPFLGTDDMREDTTQSQLRDDRSTASKVGSREFHVLMQLVKRSSQGNWDLIVSGLLSLGLALMETSNSYSPSESLTHDLPKFYFSDTNNTSQLSLTQEAHMTSTATPNQASAAETTWEGASRTDTSNSPGNVAAQQCGALGVELLAECFARHNITRMELLGQIVERVIVSNVAGFSSTTCPLQYIRLLATIAHRSPHLLMENVTTLKDMLTYLPTMLPRVAASVQMALGPLLLLRPDIIDYLLLVYRKALFQSELNSRLVAVHGLIYLIQQVHVRDHQGASQDPSGNSSQGKVHLNEVQAAALSCLRRCYSQQPQVRIAFYTGIGTLATRLPEIAQELVQLLQGHAMQYMETSSESSGVLITGCSMLKFGDCVSRGTGQLIEPLHFLLSECISSGHVNSLGSESWSSIIKNIIGAELATFGIVLESGELTNSTLTICRLLVGCCEALMNCFGMADVSLNEIIGLWKMTARVEEFVSEAAAGGSSTTTSNKTGKKRGRSRTPKQALVVLGNLVWPSTIGKLMKAITSHISNNGSFEEEFVMFVMNRALAIVTFVDQHSCPDKNAPMGVQDEIWSTVELSRMCAGSGLTKPDNAEWGQCCGALVKEYWYEKATESSLNVALLALKCISAVVQTIPDANSRRTVLRKMILVETGQASGDGTEEQEEQQLRSPELYLLMKCTCSSVTPDLGITILEILQSSVRTQAVLVGMREAIQYTHPKQDLKYITQLVSYYVDLELANSNDVSSIAWIARRLQRFHGVHSDTIGEGENSCDEDESDAVADVNWEDLEQKTLKLSTLAMGSMTQSNSILEKLSDPKGISLSWIDHRSSPKVTKVYVATLSSLLEEANWVFQHYLTRSGLEPDQRNLLERRLFQRFQMIAAGLQPLASSALPSGGESQLVLRLLSQLFKSTSQLMKNYLALKMERTGTQWLYRALKEIGTKLTVNVYGLIYNLQRVMNNSAIDREMKLIPELVFQLEQFDFHVLKLIKMGLLAKDFGRLVKRAPARDFRISSSTTAKVVQNARVAQEEEDENQEEDDDSSSQVGEKKRRVVQADEEEDDDDAENAEEEVSGTEDEEEE